MYKELHFRTQLSMHLPTNRFWNIWQKHMSILPYCCCCCFVFVFCLFIIWKSGQMVSCIKMDQAITKSFSSSPWVLLYTITHGAGWHDYYTILYSLWQFFLSNRAVYLLLWNIRLGYEHAGLDFWLSSIACHAPKAPVLVVGTHFDKVQSRRCL